jgi:hypothetical protein
MTARTAGIRRPLAEYAVRMHAAAGPVHHVASPLGAWLLAALCAPVAAGTGAEDELSAALGADPETARGWAAALLDSPHDAVLSAAGLWTRGVPWPGPLPAAVETGDLPDRAWLDAWADRHTLGLIKRFPVAVGPDVVLLLATALATKVSWEVPFDLAPGARLAGWGVERVLATPESGYFHESFVATTRAGDVAVHTARAREDLDVTSVVAAPGVPAADVIAAAYEIAAAPRRSLFDLPLGEGPLWTITERPVRTTAPDGREERCTAVLPAWSAESDHDLDRPELGLPAAAGAAAAALGLGAFGYEARQSAVAKYTRVGFEAAAVSGMGVATGYQEPRDGVERTAELRFGHPYAVVAVARQQRYDRERSATVVGPWHGLPVFSAWVAKADEAVA